MVLQNTGRYKPEGRGNPFTSGTSHGVGGSSDANNLQEDGRTDLRVRETRENEAIDAKYGFERINGQSGREVAGYLMNIHAGEMLDEDKRLIACVDLYFVEDDGGRLKVSVPFQPYFYIKVKEDQLIQEVSAFLSKKYGQYIHRMVTVRKEDLDLANHLVGLKQSFLKLSFLATNDLQRVRKDILAAVRRNRERAKTTTAYTELLAEAAAGGSGGDTGGSNVRSNPMEHIIDAREHDMPLHVRVAIDKEVRFNIHWIYSNFLDKKSQLNFPT